MVQGGGCLRRLIPFIILLLFHTASTAAEIRIDSGRQFEYAASCYEKNDYIPAIVELKRYMSFFPEGDHICEAAFLIGMSWYKGGRYGEAISQFEKITGGETGCTKTSEAWFMLAKSHIAAGNPLMAEIVLANYISSVTDADEQDKARNMIGWIRLETLRWDKASESFRMIGDKNRAVYNADNILEYLEKREKIKRKSPAVAGMAGVLPGGGYLYTGRYRDALVSFLLNGAFIYAGYEAFDHEQYALCGIVSFIGFGFYSGSIYGSVGAAHKANRNAEKNFIRNLKNRVPSAIRLGLVPDFEKKGLSVAFQYRF